jgi:3-oxoadipate enol-lactonase
LIDGETKMTFSRIRDITVHWSSSGRAGAPAIVFSNSLGTDARIWERVADLLGDRYRLVTYDSRGHGLTDATAGPYTISGLADDLIALADTAGLNRFALVGLSVGGLIAQQVAIQAPKRLSALVLCDTAAKIGTDDAWNARIQSIRAGGLESIAGMVMERWFAKSFRETRTDELAGYRNMMCRTPGAGYIATCEAIRDCDLSAEAGKITAPTLVVVGEEDGSTPPALVQATAALIPGARFEIIKNAAHMPGLEQPEVLARLIGNHLSEAGYV